MLSSINLLNAIPLRAAPLIVTPLRCSSMTNQELKPEIVNISSDEPVFYPFSIKTSRQIITQKLLKLKRNLLIIIMINILQLQSLIL